MILLLRYCCLFALLACALFCGCLGLPCNITSTHAVRRLYYQKIEKFYKDKNLGKFSLKIKRVDVDSFGDNAFTLVSFSKYMSPDVCDRMIFTREREFLRMNFVNLRAASLQEFTEPMTPDAKKAFIARFSHLLWTGNVITGIKEIPKYKAGSLASDVEQAIAPPDYNSDFVTVYTYAALGGQVNRFKFVFGHDGRLADITRVELAINIGAFFYLF